MAHATLRTFANVKSSAITPRHPSVPNLIVFTTQQYMRSGGRREAGLEENGSLPNPHRWRSRERRSANGRFQDASAGGCRFRQTSPELFSPLLVRRIQSDGVRGHFLAGGDER